MTQKYKNRYVLFSVISILLTFLPIFVYTIVAFANGAPYEKLTLGLTWIIALILFVINFIYKYHVRSTLWIILLGIYCCLDSITPLLIIMAVSTILDEFVITPMKKKYKNFYTVNKEIDKREQIKEG